MPADPATLRALAARVMAPNSTNDGINEEIARAFGYQDDPVCLYAGHMLSPGGSVIVPTPDFLTSLDAADLLMAPLRERGWRTRGGEAIAGGWYAVANHKRLAGPPICFAPTGPRARTALALLCRAVELEHADADQR